MMEQRDLDLRWSFLSTGVTLGMSPHARRLSGRDWSRRTFQLGFSVAQIVLS